MGAAGDTLGNMRQFAGDIQGIGVKMKLIALNAIVKASHMQEDGSALAALADAFHQLSVGSCGCIDSVSESLGRVTSASVALSGRFQEDGEDGTDDRILSISGALRSQIETLRSVNDSVGTYLREVCEEGEALAEDIRGTALGVDMHRRISGTMHAATLQLEALAALTQSLYPEGDSEEDAEFIRALEASYTMEKEREVHQSLLAVAASDAAHAMSGAAGEGGKEAEASEDDLGDNVELF